MSVEEGILYLCQWKTLLISTEGLTGSDLFDFYFFCGS